MTSPWKHIHTVEPPCIMVHYIASYGHKMTNLSTTKKPSFEDQIAGDGMYWCLLLAWSRVVWLNTLWPRQNGSHFPDEINKLIFLNESVWISIKISLKFVPRDPINNIPALVQIMAWRRPGDKPLPEPMMVSLLTHVCITRPQLVKDRKARH